MSFATLISNLALDIGLEGKQGISLQDLWIQIQSMQSDSAHAEKQYGKSMTFGCDDEDICDPLVSPSPRRRYMPFRSLNDAQKKSIVVHLASLPTIVVYRSNSVPEVSESSSKIDRKPGDNNMAFAETKLSVLDCSYLDFRSNKPFSTSSSSSPSTSIENIRIRATTAGRWIAWGCHQPEHAVRGALSSVRERLLDTVGRGRYAGVLQSSLVRSTIYTCTPTRAHMLERFEMSFRRAFFLCCHGLYTLRMVRRLFLCFLCSHLSLTPSHILSPYLVTPLACHPRRDPRQCVPCVATP